jgi:hypothetical protein
VIKDRVAVIVFNNKEAEKLATDIKEKIACAESSGMTGQREYDVLSQCFGRPEQHGHVRGVSSYQGWKYAWPQHCTHEDLIGMLTVPTHFGIWITWRGLQCEAALGLVHPEETTLQTVPIHVDCVVVEVITAYTIFADELLEYPPNDEVMKLGQAQGQRLQWRRCRIDIKGVPTCISHSQAIV